MTNEEMLLRALSGEELTVTEFHPQTNKQAYLAYGLGLLTDFEALPRPRTNEEMLLYMLAEQGFGGGEGGGGFYPYPEDYTTMSNYSTKSYIVDKDRALLGRDAVWLFNKGEYTKLTDNFQPWTFFGTEGGVFLSGYGQEIGFFSTVDNSFVNLGTVTGSFNNAVTTHDGCLILSNNAGLGSGRISVFDPRTKELKEGHNGGASGRGYISIGSDFSVISSTTQSYVGCEVWKDGVLTPLFTTGYRWRMVCERSDDFILVGYKTTTPVVSVSKADLTVTPLLTTDTAQSVSDGTETPGGIFFPLSGLWFLDNKTNEMVRVFEGGSSFTYKPGRDGCVIICSTSGYVGSYYFCYETHEMAQAAATSYNSAFIAYEGLNYVFVSTGRDSISIVNKETKEVIPVSKTYVGACTICYETEECAVLNTSYLGPIIFVGATGEVVTVCSQTNNNNCTVFPVSRGILISTAGGVYLCDANTGEVLKMLSTDERGHAYSQGCEVEGVVYVYGTNNGSCTFDYYDEETNELIEIADTNRGASSVYPVDGAVVFALSSMASYPTHDLLVVPDHDRTAAKHHRNDDIIDGSKVVIPNGSGFFKDGVFYLPVLGNECGSLLRYDPELLDFVIEDPTVTFEHGVATYTSYTDDDVCAVMSCLGVFVCDKTAGKCRMAGGPTEYAGGNIKLTREGDNVLYRLNDLAMLIPIHDGDAVDVHDCSEKIIMGYGGVLYAG